MTITEFLTARYDEDEAVARAAHVETVLPTMWRPELLGQGPFMEHIVRFDPARILADVAAKRAIVEMATHVEAASRLDAPEADDWMIAQEPDGWGAVIVALRHAVAILAQAYAEHPDFDPDWRVA